VGSVTESFGKRIINARILNVETGEVVATASTTVGPAAMDDFMKELLGEKGQFSATFFRSALVPGWGQIYTNHPVRAGISFVVCFGALGYTVYERFQVASANSDYKEVVAERSGAWRENADAAGIPHDQYLALLVEKEDKLYAEYSDEFYYAKILTIITGGVWALNLVDATFAGLAAKKKFNLYFSAIPKEHAGLRLVYHF
jgi:hypothetical protein